MIKNSPNNTRGNHTGGEAAGVHSLAPDSAENQAQRERDLTTAILDSVGSLVIVLDKEGRIVRFNQACEQLSGYTAEEVIGKQYWTLFLGPKDESQPPREFLESFAGQFLHNYADYVELKDGRRRFISWKNTTLRDKAGEIEFIISAGVDTTDQLNAEQALRESEERFRTLSDSAPVGVFQTDSHGQCLYTNARWQKIAGLTLEESLGEGWTRAVHPADREAVMKAWEEAIQDQREFSLEFRYRTPRNIEGWVHSRAVGLHSVTGEITGFVGTVEDITERKKAEEDRQFLAASASALAASIDYTATLDSVARLAVGKLADCCIVDIMGESGTAQRVVAAHVDPVKEKAARNGIRFALMPNASHPIVKVLNTGQSVLVSEVTSEFLDSVALNPELHELAEILAPKSLMIVPLVSRDKVLGAISFISSSPSRKYTPADLTLAEELAGRAAIAVENARLYMQAQEAVTSREELLSIVSHDLKNYLMVLRGFAYLLPEFVRRDGGPETAQLLEGLGQIDTTSAQMDMVVQDLLDFARLQVGKPLDLYKQPVELVSLARRVVQQQQRTTSQHMIVLQEAVSELHGTWDKDRIERSLANLLSNAIKYSPRGTQITVTLNRENAAGNDMAVLSVRDEGIGIPADDLPRIFDRFHRSRNVRRVSGTGIGLSSTLQIVEQHGGTIGVESEEGVGSTFTLRLPMALPSPVAE